MLLKSRLYQTPDEFLTDFLSSITPGIIPRKDFIKWTSIQNKLSKLAQYNELFIELKEQLSQGKSFITELADCLLAADDPLPYIECAFELLGHTNVGIVTKQDDIDFVSSAKAIKAGDRGAAVRISTFLEDVGFKFVLSRDDLEDVLFGVQVGLETHRRKNVGGKFFIDEIKKTLKPIVAKVNKKIKQDIKLQEEVRIPYGKGLLKKVDFALEVQGTINFAIEVNFYTVPGSKPTEIKRSYGEILQGFKKKNISFVWITDGKGYKKMQRSIRDAYIILPNIYNLHQAGKYLRKDLILALNNPSK